MNRRGRVWRFAIPALTAALALTGCGGGNADTQDTVVSGDTDPAGTTPGTGETPSTTTPDGGTVVSTSTSPPPTCQSPAGVPDQLDDVSALISATLLPDWTAQKHDAGYTSNRCWHDWDSDDCSAPGLGSSGISYDFIHPCHRHDFGYRNFKRLETETTEDIWNAANKFATDDAFLGDMREHCSSRPWYLKPQCLGWAQAYYYAVRAFG